MLYNGAMNEGDKKESRPRGKRFFRSRDNRILSGFCGGLGGYFNIDPIIIRLGFIALLFFIQAGLGVVLFYIIGSLVTPIEPKA